jgi:hypothetical protein
MRQPPRKRCRAGSQLGPHPQTKFQPLVESIENGIEAEKRKQQEFFELAKRFRNATDPKEAKRRGDELGRTGFGS